MSTAPPDRTTPLWTSFLEVIHPTGRCPPRDVTIQTRSPKDIFTMQFEMDERVKERTDIQLGKVPMKMTPTIGEHIRDVPRYDLTVLSFIGQQQAVTFQGHTLHFQYYQVKRDSYWASNWVQISYASIPSPERIRGS